MKKILRTLYGMALIAAAMVGILAIDSAPVDWETQSFLVICLAALIGIFAWPLV